MLMPRVLVVSLLAGVVPTVAASELALKTPTSLDPIVVHPRIDPLDESMHRLRQSLQDPDCRGCPPELRAYRKSIYEQLGDAVGYITGIGFSPPQLSPQERTELRVRNDWRKVEWGPEMDDFR